ncbi:hypothetical protein [Weissella confusa]|uniref:hypothetical protein n=1 Tax=Weissella confusa TaxID=1583 RepID=UPI0018F252A3|nr:hypothetical protein [Weissella confusa]MBJ7674004.1 hypothetical protein [Weissella confusa]
MTVTVSFNAPQIQVSNSSTGIQLSQVILPYSIRNSEDSTQYLGGQMTLGQSDGIKLTDNTKDWERLGLAKIKNMVAYAEIYVPDPIVEVPVSSADNSVASSEATVASSSVEAPVSSAEAPVSSVAPVSSASAVASSTESQVTTAPSESTTEE